jgi:hypothetical protein
MAALSDALVGHWPLAGDTADHSPLAHPTQNSGVELGARGPGGRPGTAAHFGGGGVRLEVADHASLRFGTGDLSLAAWVHTAAIGGDVIGSIVSKFDPDSRQGLHLYGLTQAGVTSTAQPNFRHLQFGIDAARVDPAWTDCGRPGNAIFVPALLSTGNLLYAATLELGDGEAGGLWRYDGGQKWVSLGNPARSSVIHSAVQFDGRLYCGTGRYIGAGSALPEPRNQTPGGTVWRLDPEAPAAGWEYCGHPGAEGATPEEEPVRGFSTGKADDVVALTVYRGALYCASNHRRGVFRYEGGQEWTAVGLADQRVMTFTIYRGRLYALINGGPVYRYESGADWTLCGCPDRSTQTYGATTLGGALYVGTWPEGELFRYAGGEAWTCIGRVGYEREVMGLAHYNGKMYLGTLPMANVWRLDGTRFTLTGTLDHSAAPLRRVWSLAVHQGRLFAGTLPSGHVWALEAGKMATWDHTFPGGWHHVAAVKEGGRLKLYVDGSAVAWSTPFHPADYDLSNDQPLQIGFGAYEYFDGLLSDVRIYRRALRERELAELAQPDSAASAS